MQNPQRCFDCKSSFCGNDASADAICVSSADGNVWIAKLAQRMFPVLVSCSLKKLTHFQIWPTPALLTFGSIWVEISLVVQIFISHSWRMRTSAQCLGQCLHFKKLLKTVLLVWKLHSNCSFKNKETLSGYFFDLKDFVCSRELVQRYIVWRSIIGICQNPLSPLRIKVCEEKLNLL